MMLLFLLVKYKWIIKEEPQFEKDFLEIAFNSEIIAKLLFKRGINTVGKAKSYLNPKFYIESSPEEIPQLVKAKDRIIEAINKKEKITIFGDYDVDGVTSTSCLLIALRQFTDKIDFYIPNRLTEGYGLNNGAVKIIAKKHKAKLLITCDCGITNHKEIELANSLGMDVIVTDHHSLPEILPPACAVLNPKLLPPDHKLYFLPGVGVAYKLAEAILKSQITNQKSQIENCNDLLDLVCLGMIADLAPLVDENRYLVQIGLPKLASTNKVGLQELLRICGYRNEPANRPPKASLARGGRSGESEKGGTGGIALGTDHVGFGIAPRINAIGRLADANLAVKLLITNDLQEAIQIACELDFQNKQRQSLCEGTLNEAISIIEEEVDLKNDKCIVLANDNWHHGVIGIVASRVVEKFGLPTILIAIDKEQNIARGSGRSVEQLNIVEAVVASSKHLEKFGGHKAACGLSVRPEKINDFVFDFKKIVSEYLDGISLGPILKIDCELSLSNLSMELMEKIYKLSPFGFGNPMPMFVSEEAQIVSVRNIGKNNQHLKLSVKDTGHGKIFESLIWNYDNSVQFSLKDKVALAYTPKVNNFNGEKFIQLEVKDWELGRTGTRNRTGEPESRRAGEEQREQIIELHDFRQKTKECLDIVSGAQVIYFAEVSQKDFLPLKTFSRNKIIKRESLVFLEIPPDESTFIEIIKASEANKIYLAFPRPQDLPTSGPRDLLKRLIGMLKYVKSNKASKVSEIELQGALGINKTTLAFALETLTRIGFLKYDKEGEKLDINISSLTQNDLQELIEYNLLLDELKQIAKFKEELFSTKIEPLAKILNKQKIQTKIMFEEKLVRL